MADSSITAELAAMTQASPEIRERQIVAFGGGGFSQECGNPLLDDYVLGLTGKKRPKVCFLATASGDSDDYVVRFYKEFGSRTEASHLGLFKRRRGIADVREHLLSQDLIYVGGGSLVSLLGVWQGHGIDAILRDAWRKGIVLCGLSAGALCWFDRALTAYYGPPEQLKGLGMLPWSFTAHYDSEPARRAEFHRGIERGMPAGYAADDGAAMHFVGGELHKVVSSRPNAHGYSVGFDGRRIVEVPLETQFLGATDPVVEMAVA